MNNFDEIIREKARLESISLPVGFDERNDILIEKLSTNNVNVKKPRTFYILRYRTAIVLIAAILIIGSTTIAAEQLTGGDFFTQFFNEEVNNDNINNFGFMNTEQLNNISSSTIGTVISTDEVNIDVLGVVISGNTVNVMLKVTANKLNSVLHNNGNIVLNNYRFQDERGSLFESSKETTTTYYFSDEDSNLKDNEFKILYKCIGNYNSDKYTINLDKLGYYNQNLDFVNIYDAGWQFDISFDTKADYSKDIFIDQDIFIDDLSLRFNNIQITPFTCLLYFENDKDFVYDDYEKFSDNVSSITIKLKDGTILNSTYFKYTCGFDSETNIYGAILDFTVPITVNDVESITIFDQDYLIN